MGKHPVYPSKTLDNIIERNIMATKPKRTVENTLDFDLTEFKRQKQLVEQHASKGVSERVEQIISLIREIKELVEVAGVEVKLKNELEYVIDEVDELHKDWNSSSMYC